jgi:TolB-like protein/DNA-binding winged helix-turn-helix (wHTH) protein/tetratricopeptide (TPR) repeat protein
VLILFSLPKNTHSGQALELGFQLGELSIEPRTGEVTGPGGCEKLDPRVMGVFVMLAQHAGQVVSRDDLHARLWPGISVTDDALSRCIYELRRQLSQASGNPQLKASIETIPKRGYRLRAEITLPGVLTGDPPRRRPWRLAVVAAAGVLLAALIWIAFDRQTPESAIPPPATSASNSIAVLPFVDMSAEQNQGYLADGISEEILNRLAQAGKLLVISRTSSFVFRNESMDIRDIAAKLDVRHVLEGSVRKSGDSIRITAQLIAASDNSHLWSETFDRKLGDLFAIQDEIAASVATALQVRLAGGEPHDRMPGTIEAYENYLHGQFFFHRRTSGDVERSAGYYEDAVAMDPGYARAWAALAGAYSLLAYDDPKSVKVLLDKQFKAASKAVALDPTLAVAHARLARYHFSTNNTEAGRHHSQLAATLDPDDLLVLGGLADEATSRGDLDSAIDSWRRSIALDPLATPARINLALTLAADGQFDKALPELRKVMDLRADNSPDIKLEIVRVLILSGRFDEAQSELATIPEGKLRDQGLALLYELPARRAEAVAALERLAAAEAMDTRDAIRLADAYSNRGMREQTFAVLQASKKVSAHNRIFGVETAWSFRADLRIAPFLKPLHSDPRWDELVAP